MTPTVSPSQINDAKDCLRKWAWPKLDGIKAMPHRSAQAGTAVHSILEQWLLKGTPPDTEAKLVLDGREYRTGLIAVGGIHHLPPPGHVLVEREFRFGHWLGRIDHAWATKGGVLVPPSQINPEDPDQIPGIGDHKTTGNMGFALDEEKLRSDPQGVIYANAIFDEFRRAQYADELWVYFGTSKPYPSKKVHIRVERDEVRAKLEPMNALAEQLIRLRSSGLKALDLPPSPEACENYGGCPHRGRCGLSASQLMKGYFAMNQMSTEDMIKKATEAAAGSMNGVSPAPAIEAPVAAPTDPAPAAGCILTPGWRVHPYDSTVEWHPPTNEWRKMQMQPPPVAAPPPVLAPPALSAPPPIVQAAPALPPPATQAAPPPVLAAPLPPIVPVTAPVVAQLPPGIGPDGQPFGSVNAPEGINVPDKAELSPVTAATGAKDDLDLMSKEQLVALATSMGLETKRLRESGLRDKIRAARASGTVGTMPSGATVTQTTLGAAPAATFATGGGIDDDDAREIIHLDRVTQIVAAMIIKGYPFDGMIKTAKNIVDEIEAE